MARHPSAADLSPWLLDCGGTTLLAEIEMKRERASEHDGRHKLAPVRTTEEELEGGMTLEEPQAKIKKGEGQ
jgi:hypothetical protein